MVQNIMGLNQLPIHTFQINYTSDLDGQTYVGLFSARKKVLSDEARIKIKKVQLNGGLHYDSDNPGQGMDFETDQMNYIIASLQTLLTQSPPWYDLDNIIDFNLVIEVWKEVVKFQNSFRKQPKHVSSSESRSSTVAPVSNEPGSTPDMVVAEIQGFLEPR